ncbi:MAG: hypothetical protein GYB36_11395 [Alphaproteobacteria bacterium]|nr:hypothetical protein [Alphaproteobacteria bacterium]
MLRYLFVLTPLIASFICAVWFDGMIYDAELGAAIGILASLVLLAVASILWFVGVVWALLIPRSPIKGISFSGFVILLGGIVLLAGLWGLSLYYSGHAAGAHAQRFGYFPYTSILAIYAGALTALGALTQMGRDCR